MKIKEKEFLIDECLEALFFSIYNCIGGEWQEGEPDPELSGPWYHTNGSYQVPNTNIRFDYELGHEPADEHMSFCCKVYEGDEELDESCGFFGGDMPFIYIIIYALSKWFDIDVQKN